MRLGFVFPGQGSQHLGMLYDLAAAHAIVRETFTEASGVLGYDLWGLVQEGPESELSATHKTQPAMLAAGVATWRVWLERGGTKPAFLAGHSLGEYSALVCAGSIAYRDAVVLVSERGQYMQEAVAAGAGAMAAILGLSDREVEETTEAAAQGQVVACANFNSPGQVVIAGETAAVERAVANAKAAGAKHAVTLPVSVPSHCELMRPAASRLARRLREIRVVAPAIPVLHNVDVSIRLEPEAIVEALVEQLFRPVRWVDVVKRLRSKGVHTLIECGPGKVLTGLCKRIDKSVRCTPVVDTQSLEEALALTG